MINENEILEIIKNKITDDYDKDLYEIYNEKEINNKEINKNIFNSYITKWEKINKIYENYNEKLNSFQPNIWVKAMMNYPDIKELIESNDEIILNNLINISFKPNYEESEIIFKFKENEYFTNNNLNIKLFHDKNKIKKVNKIVSSEINWKKNMNPFFDDNDFIEFINLKSKKVIKKPKKIEKFSFFIFFSNLDYSDININYENKNYCILESVSNKSKFKTNLKNILRNKEDLYLNIIKLIFDLEKFVLPYLIPLFLDTQLSFIEKSSNNSSYEFSDNHSDSSHDFDYVLENDYSKYKIRKYSYKF